MDRRRGLLSQSKAGSGKVVNVITLKPYIFTGSGTFDYLQINYSALFPVSSNITINIETNGMFGTALLHMGIGVQSGKTSETDLNPSSSEITVISIDPQEDDTYIYEVVVEY